MDWFMLTLVITVDIRLLCDISILAQTFKNKELRHGSARWKKWIFLDLMFPISMALDGYYNFAILAVLQWVMTIIIFLTGLHYEKEKIKKEAGTD